MISEFQNRGKNNIFIDNRIGGNNALSKMPEEDKMRLRYLREQKEQMKQTKVTRKRAKYNLDDLYSDEDNGGGLGDHLGGGFTHGGRPLDNMDDFQDAIPVSSDDEEGADRDQQQGKLNEEMVMHMNFGGSQQPTYGDNYGGRNDNGQKTRKEVFEEIIAKSKAYKMAKYEVKEAGKELTTRLDGDYFDILSLMNMSKMREAPLGQQPIDSYE